jgi:hypothetical protein
MSSTHMRLLHLTGPPTHRCPVAHGARRPRSPRRTGDDGVIPVRAGGPGGAVVEGVAGREPGGTGDVGVRRGMPARRRIGSRLRRRSSPRPGADAAAGRGAGQARVVQRGVGTVGPPIPLGSIDVQPPPRAALGTRAGPHRADRSALAPLCQAGRGGESAGHGSRQRSRRVSGRHGTGRRSRDWAIPRTSRATPGRPQRGRHPGCPRRPCRGAGGDAAFAPLPAALLTRDASRCGRRRSRVPRLSRFGSEEGSTSRPRYRRGGSLQPPAPGGSRRAPHRHPRTRSSCSVRLHRLAGTLGDQWPRGAGAAAPSSGSRWTAPSLPGPPRMPPTSSWAAVPEPLEGGGGPRAAGEAPPALPARVGSSSPKSCRHPGGSCALHPGRTVRSDRLAARPARDRAGKTRAGRPTIRTPLPRALVLAPGHRRAAPPASPGGGTFFHTLVGRPAVGPTRR